MIADGTRPDQWETVTWPTYRSIYSATLHFGARANRPTTEASVGRECKASSM